jgi:putative hydrolase of the HAD superfamily
VTDIPHALLFDFGSVVSVSVFERHRQTEKQLGLPVGSLPWQGPIAPETDPLWQAMLREELSERDYWARRAREMGEAVGESGWDMAAMLRRMNAARPQDVVRPEMRALLSGARARGLRLGILSNEMELFYGRELIERMQILPAFDVVVDASSTLILKPDPRAYALAVEQLGVPAAAVLFVDDQFRNVAGAVRAGLQAQHFDLRDVPGSLAAVVARARLTREVPS